MEKEAKARLIINRMLIESGWRLEDTPTECANVSLESNVKINKNATDVLGDNFEKTKNGFVDYVLNNRKDFPIAVLEAKKESLEPLVGKEQARTYAQSAGKNCRFVILSNGNTHYLWDLLLGNPKQIFKFPTLEELENFDTYKPQTKSLATEIVGSDYIARTQLSDYDSDPNWLDETKRAEFIEQNKLKFLRPFQINAVHAIQKAVKMENKNRFLFEMATGTGKTLTSAAVIKLFLRTGAANRVLFLVDRIELEDQAKAAFEQYLKLDFQTTTFKESRNNNDWKKYEIVVSTVQTLTKHNLYKRVFRETDFDLIISDEAHRSIGGNARAVFEYFIGYKLGLTATPRNYLKKFDGANAKDPRELERRLMLDTYNIFDCENDKPTFSYTLLDGVREGYLINPFVIDARTDITTQMLSDSGYSVMRTDEQTDELDLPENTDPDIIFKVRDFEHTFFSERTNRIFCETFMNNALRDPITSEIGKTIIFCVSQNHAGKIAQMLNELALEMFPNRYQSDFAMQVTSKIPEAQTFTKQFANNNLRGNGNFNALYKTAKARVCATVGMMTTGYDCPDILNVVLMRPIFSPTDFVQIKGRGTRPHDFTKKDILLDRELPKLCATPNKTKFALFDFFANCEYFEEKFDYDKVIALPQPKKYTGEKKDTVINDPEVYDSFRSDWITYKIETQIGADGMKIDRKMFEHYEETVMADAVLEKFVNAGNRDAAENYVIDNIFDKPNEFYNLEKLRQSIRADRRISIWETLQKAFGVIPYIKNMDELKNEEWEKFDTRFKPSEKDYQNAELFFKAYLTDNEIQKIIETRKYAKFRTHPNGESFLELSPKLQQLIPNYIKDNISINRFMQS